MAIWRSARAFVVVGNHHVVNYIDGLLLKHFDRNLDGASPFEKVVIEIVIYKIRVAFSACKVTRALRFHLSRLN